MQQNYATQVNKLINVLMQRGKKTKAKRILFDALYLIKKKTSKNPIYILRKALANCTPVIECVPQKRGSKIYRIPSPIKESRAHFFAASWIVKGARKKTGKMGRGQNNFAHKLCQELIEDANGTGTACSEKKAIYNIAIENRPFMRY